MNPLIRIFLVTAALIGVFLVGRTLLPAINANLTALKSWTRTQGEVRAMPGTIEFELGTEPSAYRAFANVDHTWGLSLFKKVPLFVDPADPSRIKPAGFLQMWLAPAQMAGLILLLLIIAGFAARNPSAAGQWQFTPAPAPLSDAIHLRSPAKQWKIVLGWSLLGVAMANIVALGSERSHPGAMFYIALGSAFAITLWIFAWHTKTMEISASPQGVRMTSVLGWREVPWNLIHGAEQQDIFTTYYNSKMRMWELPFPGSTIRVLAFTNQQGRTLMSFSPELEPTSALKQLFELCTKQTGAQIQHRDLPLPW